MRTLSAGQYRNVGACLPACLPGPLLLKHSLVVTLFEDTPFEGAPFEGVAVGSMFFS